MSWSEAPRGWLSCCAVRRARAALQAQLSVIGNSFARLKTVVGHMAIGDSARNAQGVESQGPAPMEVGAIGPVKCRSCGKLGHMAVGCWQPGGVKADKGKSGKGKTKQTTGKGKGGKP